MGFVDSGVVVTTSKRHFRRKGRVNKQTLAKIVELLNIPRAQRARLGSDVKSIHIFGGGGRGGRARSRGRRR